MRRCTKCIEPETAPKIEFDADGVCNYCHSHKKFSYYGEEKLKQLLDSKRRTDTKYDCIVMMSGGRDSTYVLLKMVKDYRMKVLAVNYENPFTHPQATKNIANATKLLNVDLVSIKDKNNRHINSFRKNVQAWFKKPSPAMIPMVCIACKSMWLGTIQIAKKYDINFIVSGGNRYEEISFKRELLGVSRDEERKNKFNRALPGLIREFVNNPGYLSPTCIPIMIEGYLFANEHGIGSKLLGYQMDRIQLFEYIPWVEEEVISRITNELKWDYPHEYGGTWRFDCKIGHIREYMSHITLKMSEREDLYSKMIREGTISREEALNRLEKENKIHMNEIQEVLQKAGISDPDFIKKGYS